MDLELGQDSARKTRKRVRQSHIRNKIGTHVQDDDKKKALLLLRRWNSQKSFTSTMPCAKSRSSTPAFRRAIAFTRKRKRLFTFLVLVIPFMLRPSRLWRWPARYLGIQPAHGVDYYLLRKAYFMHKKAEQKRLEAVGIDLPTIEVYDEQNRIDMLVLNTRASKRERLIRRESRNRLWLALNETAKLSCDNSRLLHPNISLWSHQVNLCGIPRVLFAAHVPGSYPPRPGPLQRSNLTVFYFDHAEMKGLLKSEGIPTWKGASELELTWSLYAMWRYGGFLVRHETDASSYDIPAILSKYKRKVPAASLFMKTGSGNGGIEVDFIAATPRHPIIRCLVQAMKTTRPAQVINDLFRNGDFYRGTVKASRMLVLDCPSASNDCCKFVQKLDSEPSKPGEPFLRMVVRAHANQTMERGALPGVRIERADQMDLKTVPKNGLTESLEAGGATPGWICTRCLKSALYGSIQKCLGYFCSADYEKIICNASDDAPTEDLEIHVDVTMPDDGNPRIPRIVHQTWFEDITMDRYGDLVRLQDSWKNSGWEYRFYSDVDAKDFILRNFPRHFADAFDILLPGAYKADYFRYLVLLKEGGVYADVDVMLTTDLDAFISPDMSFFVPRDVVAEYAGQPFCLWNGFLGKIIWCLEGTSLALTSIPAGSSPGHPFMVKVVERLVNLILQRADQYDLERDLCRASSDPLEVWKVRSQPLLLLSGPCALGVAVNEAMERPSLASFDYGWLDLEQLNEADGVDHGDAMIMVGDKYDMGAFRMSDTERHFPVAATDLDGVDKESHSLSVPSPIDTVPVTDSETSRPHYSDSARNVGVWGTENVYKNKEVSLARISLKVTYSRSSSDSSPQQ